ncbi:hypothetical protein HOLleu_45063 [Holothuria leucospilota]|uniref:Uncharacterized protein n=1 Tax=Holothuria leucospilota TaxID=206669 RepID=A0A9Q0YA85_HOLLE|nr:hypothetical protein HOLleu_45063 [Holothuria leucospilota]
MAYRKRSVKTDSLYERKCSHGTPNERNVRQCYKTTRQKHWIESIDERMESSREFNFNAAFLELSRSENCLRYVAITTIIEERHPNTSSRDTIESRRYSAVRLLTESYEASH